MTREGDGDALLRVGAIQKRILRLRGERAVVDADLASIHGVPTRCLNEQVKQNRGRFPAAVSFRLTREEKREVVAICDHLSGR